MQKRWLIPAMAFWIVTGLSATYSHLSHTSRVEPAINERSEVQYVGLNTPRTFEFDSSFDQQDPDACFDCHDDDSFTMDRDGREISLHVAPDRYTASQHGRLDCLDCHVDYDPDEEPHLENAPPVNCSTCHASSVREFSRGTHRSELSCASCHDDLHTRPGTLAGVTSCRRCHIVATEAVEQSVHHDGDFGPSCLDCHTSHAFAAANTTTCLSCHGEREFVHEHVTDEDVDAILAYEDSIHGDMIDCSDCHAGHLVLETTDPLSPVSRPNVASTCANCHDEEAAEYLSSEHGKALESGFEGAPTCTDCHGEHDVHQITDSDSPVSRAHEIEVCMACHLNVPEVQARMTHSPGFIASYEESVHGREIAAGNLDAAICSDCHGAHEEMKASDPNSRMSKFNIAETCAQCHESIATVFIESIHGQALEKQIADAPTCTTCHSEHGIAETSSADSPVAARNVSEQTCNPCHSSYKLSAKYGFPSDRSTSFADSYHGLADRFGSSETANCASCHGIHAIWPSSDTRSNVHPDNLDNTCGQCHPGANENFARGAVHIVRTAKGDRWLFWISRIYILVIVVTIATMALHNILDWWRKVVDQYRERHEPVRLPAVGDRKTGLYVRMTVNERWQHALLATSFLLLVFTGFMLKFPDSWWVVALRETFAEGLFELRSLLHRIAAVVMVADSLYHIYYISMTKRGRQFIRDIMVKKSDLSEMKQVLLYNLGRTKQRPRFDRFNYVEKSEYWALIWGTIVMTVTGVVLWFASYFMGHYSKLFVDINETIHYFEAWLAFLAIVVWHFYYVIFNPDVYPMSFVWLSGKMNEEEMEREHPVELERIKSSEDELADPTTPNE